MNLYRFFPGGRGRLNPPLLFIHYRGCLFETVLTPLISAPGTGFPLVESKPTGIPIISISPTSPPSFSLFCSFANSFLEPFTTTSGFSLLLPLFSSSPHAAAPFSAPQATASDLYAADSTNADLDPYLSHERDTGLSRRLRFDYVYDLAHRHQSSPFSIPFFLISVFLRSLSSRNRRRSFSRSRSSSSRGRSTMASEGRFGSF